MAIVSKSFDEPDELVTQPLVSVQVVVLGEVYVARQVHQPGRSWSEHVQPIADTATCQHHHQGVALSGQVEIEMEGGARRIVHAGEAFDIPPGHLSRVVGDEPYVTIEFAGVRGWAKPPESGERVVATLLMTDIVSSTDLAVRLGDAAWKEILASHGDRNLPPRPGFGSRPPVAARLHHGHVSFPRRFRLGSPTSLLQASWS